MSKDRNKPPNIEEALARLSKHAAAMEARNAELVARVTAAAERDMTPRERRAQSNRKLQEYHVSVAAGGPRYRAPTRTERDRAEEHGGDVDDAA